MKRLRATIVLLGAAATAAAGCGYGEYNERMEQTVRDLKEEQKLKTYTEEPAQGKLKEMNITLRVPKKMAEDAIQLSQSPGMFDYAGTYSVTPDSPPAKDGETPAVLPPLKLHVLARQKAKKAPPKKGDEPAPAPEAAADAAPAARGDFVADVRAILAADFGGDVADKSPTKVTVGKTNFQSFKFTAGSGDTIRAYLVPDANRGELQAALIFDIPPALQTSPLVTTGVELCLKSFAAGVKAPKPSGGGKEDGGGAAF